MALQTITSKHRNLRQITIRMPRHLAYLEILANGTQSAKKVASEQWLDLDRLLVQLSESRSIRPRFMSTGRGARAEMRDLLPEITERGMIDLIKY
jgi:hypothetical protein